MARVSPWYIYKFKAYTKERWVGQNLLDVLAGEFKRRTRLYFEKAVEAGSILVNNEKVPKEYALRHGDLITHTTHRHEPPIPTERIPVVFQDDRIVVVDKPAGIPCHPNSSYNKNTLSEIVKRQRSLEYVSVQNRLDKQTSGVVILAKTPEAAVEYHKKMEERAGTKIYLCKVQGEFPEEEVVVSLPLVISRKTCTTEIHDIEGLQGKPSTTIFKRVYSAGGESVLACGLVTGRTHQIRVHLQGIGYPIVDDMLYRRPYLRPDALLEEVQGKTPERVHIHEGVYREMVRKQGVCLTPEYAGSLLSAGECRTDDFVDDVELLQKIETADVGRFVQESCMHCRNPETLDVLPKFLTLSLHAWIYSIGGKTFKTELPEWCTEGVDESACISAMEQAKEEVSEQVNSSEQVNK
ncbi:uncharacterized protein NEMAJ01_1723 [Nematocida major]|uniref:uncharacterized protein n=1 Tax=Nematocida major TaxID=1912982 RepID=UPI00200821E3|nr:uncharacterized protein NEMAJ01_1723 [Nematocida major]KAH9386827.1 hypothetical protein NEMAJ01_1723 [Nematocida major]